MSCDENEVKRCPYGACDGSGVIKNVVPFGSTEATEYLDCECKELMKMTPDEMVAKARELTAPDRWDPYTDF